MTPQIIIIDDDPISSKIAEISILRNKPDVKVKVFNNPVEALENITANYTLLSKEFSTLLLIDINMPEMSGWEFIESLNQNIPMVETNFKGIILSSSVDPADIEKSKEYPRIVHYLTKPFTLDMANSIDQWFA
jgi:CheY-like chemotaxis protein